MSRFRHLRKEEGMGRKWWLVLCAAVVGALIVTSIGAADENPIDRDEYGHLSGGLTHLFALGGGGGVGGGSLPKSTCTSTGNPAANIRLNCDSNTSPDNETPIVTDPANPNHLLAGSNDYFITQKGSGIQERVPTGFFTSFDGGHTWTDGQIPMGNGGSGRNGVPSPGFEAKCRTPHMALITAAIWHGCRPEAGHICISVSTSDDGGPTPEPPVAGDGRQS